MKLKKHLLITSLVLSFLSDIVSQTIAGGGRHSYSICSDSTIYAWGSNIYGQLGDGSNNNSNTPIQVINLSKIIKIAEGVEDHSLAVDKNGNVFAWGLNEYGQLGTGNTNNSQTPIQISNLSNIVQVSGGYGHSLALDVNGNVFAWGMNNLGQLGTGNFDNSTLPIQILGLNNIVKISSRQYHSMAIDADGNLYTWGYNNSGQLGNGSFENSNIPIQINTISEITDIAAGWGHSLALSNSGIIYSWGYNLDGAIGNGTNINTNLPVQVNSNVIFIDIAAGVSQSFGLSETGEIYSWGLNNYGQLGIGNNLNSNIPLLINSISDISEIAAGGDYHALARNNSSIIYTWGINDNGQLGNGENINYDTPNQTSIFCLNVTQLKEQENSVICVFPNPSNGNFKINSKDLKRINIFNLRGELIKYEINNEIISLPNGFYIAKIQTENTIESIKIIVN